MLRRVAIVRTDVSEVRSASVSSVTRFGANICPSSSILFTLILGALRFFETSVLTRAKRRYSKIHYFMDDILYVSAKAELAGGSREQERERDLTLNTRTRR
jgi:hypothetical protein